jgi:hypothetical protein
LLILLCHTTDEINSKEQKMKKITIISSSITLALALALNGCGGGGSNASASAGGISISGKAIDPELSGSTVCLDINHDGVCNGNDPRTHTNERGDYVLAITEEQHNHYHALLVRGGTDIGTNQPFAGTLTAVKEAHQTAHNITPLTTMVEQRYQYCQTHDGCQETIDAIESNLANYLGLAEDEINSDIVALANRGTARPLQVALSLERSAESHNHANTLALYHTLAEHGYATGKGWRTEIGAVAGANAANTVNTIMNTGGNAHEIAHQIAHGAHDTAHQTAQDAHDTAHQTAQDAHDTAHQTAQDAHDTVENNVANTANAVAASVGL